MIFFCFLLYGRDVEILSAVDLKNLSHVNHRIFLQAQGEYAILIKYEFTL